ncbi:carbohydrate ABC transporter permease [Haloarcula marina]|uniref:carbohydrate ABC transporter permease n=1 Tax=Haloarcula marina TaxID=2961574 RepID=UPI0020B7CBF4|nr:sugar ABC transporter permease [Halomicroarcula marina]
MNTLTQRIRDSELLRSTPFWLPPTLIVGLAIYGSISWNVLISFTDFEGLTLPTYDVSTFDLEMYRQLFSDPVFWNATKNTFILMVVFTLLCLLTGLGLAILIDKGIRYENTIRTIYLLPFSLSFVVTAKFWLWMYNPDIGVVNTFFEGIGLEFLALNWLSPRLKLWSIIIGLVWQFSGYAMVVYLAGLRAIPDAQYEAANIDGANTLTVYLRIIIPQLRTSTVSAAVVLVVFGLKAFDFIYALFRVNPGPNADILATMMYRQAYSANNWAYGSAIAVALFVVALMIIGPYLYSEYQRGGL